MGASESFKVLVERKAREHALVIARTGLRTGRPLFGRRGAVKAKKTPASGFLKVWEQVVVQGRNGFLFDAEIREMRDGAREVHCIRCVREGIKGPNGRLVEPARFTKAEYEEFMASGAALEHICPDELERATAMRRRRRKIVIGGGGE